MLPPTDSALGNAVPDLRAELAALYSENYFRHYRSTQGCVSYGHSEPWLTFFAELASEIVRSLRPRRVLDAGCAMGLLVEALWDRGVEAAGIDISEYAIAHVRRDMRPYCRRASVTEPIADTYDLVTCIEVLEHLDPQDTETAIANLCQAGDAILFSSHPEAYDDPTHSNVRPILDWLKLFSVQGFWPDLIFDATFISPHAILFRRQSACYPDGVLALYATGIRHRMTAARLNREAGELRQRLAQSELAGAQALARLQTDFENERRDFQSILAGARAEYDAERHLREQAAGAYDRLSKQYAELEADSRRLKDRVLALESDTAELARIREENRTLQLSLDQLGRENESIRADLERERVERNDALSEKADYAARLEAAQRRHEEIERSLRSAVEEGEIRLQELLAQLRDEQSRAGSLRDEIRSLNERRAALEAARNLLETRMEDGHARIRSLEIELERSERDREDLRRVHDNLRAECLSLRGELDSAQRELSEVRQQSVVLADLSGRSEAARARLERELIQARILLLERQRRLENILPRLKHLRLGRIEIEERLQTIENSPGWKVIERYRSWRERSFTGRPRSERMYETAFWRTLVKFGIQPQTQSLRPSPALDPEWDWVEAALQSTLEEGGEVKLPEVAAGPECGKFALFISGCPGDSFRYRCEHQAEELRLIGLSVDTAYFDRVRYEEILRRYELFLLHRVPVTPAVEAFVRAARAFGKPVIFDTDDLIFNEELAAEIKAIRDFSEPERELYMDGLRRYRRTLACSSGALVTTEALRDAIREILPDMPVYVNRNAVSDEMVRLAADAIKNVPRPSGSAVRIAYFSGTRTHNVDFEECLPALVRLFETYEFVRLVLVGHIDIPPALRRFHSRIEAIPLLPWRELPRQMRRVDINLAPLEMNNRFTAAKSELKYYEAALLGLPTVASDRPAYRVAITHGENGYLCALPDQWYEALERLSTDAALREKMGARAREDVQRRYTTRARAPQLAQALSGLLRDHIERGAAVPRDRKLSVAFILRAPIAHTGGGYRTIFNLGNNLALRGHDVHYYVEPIAHLAGLSDAEIVEFCHSAFGKSPARIHVGHENIAPSDVAIATNWPTAYTLDRLANTICKVYLVQDFEAHFYEPDDPLHHEAEKTYDLPLKKVAVGRYLSNLFGSRDGLPVPCIPFHVDRTLFYDRGVREANRRVRVLFFARPGLKRRGYPAGVAALSLLARACPDVEIAFYGMKERQDIGFPYTNLGELSREQVAMEMSRSDIHLSFSLTNISWVPFEAMACGCAVVEAKVPSVEEMLISDSEPCLLASPEPEAVANALIRLARDAGLRRSLGASAKRFIELQSCADLREEARRFEEILLNSVFRDAGARDELRRE